MYACMYVCLCFSVCVCVLKTHIFPGPIFQDFDELDIAKDEKIENVIGESRALIWFLQPHQAFLFLTTPSLRFLPKSQAMPFVPQSETRRIRWKRLLKAANLVKKRK